MNGLFSAQRYQYDSQLYVAVEEALFGFANDDTVRPTLSYLVLMTMMLQDNSVFCDNMRSSRN